jgi:PAS domain S-box-containing protein
MNSHPNGKASRKEKTERFPTLEPVLLSSQFFHLLLDAIPSPIFFKDTQGRYLGCNDAFVNYIGLSRQDIVGRTVHDIAPRELAEVYQRQDQELFDHPGVQVYEARVRYADGSLHDVIFRKATFPGERSQVGGVVGVIFDITDRTHRIVADNTYDWETWLKPDGQLAYCSPSCERITGHGREEFLADPNLLVRIVHPEDLPLYLGHRHAVQAGSFPSAEEIQFRIIRPDGTIRWIGHACQPVFDREGQCLGSRVSNRDISAQKLAEEALFASERRYRALFNEMTEGLALHELCLDENGERLDFRFLEINPAFEKLMDVKREDVLGRLVSEILPAEAPLWVRLSTEVALTGKSAQFPP